MTHAERDRHAHIELAAALEHDHRAQLARQSKADWAEPQAICQSCLESVSLFRTRADGEGNLFCRPCAKLNGIEPADVA